MPRRIGQRRILIYAAALGVIILLSALGWLWPLRRLVVVVMDPALTRLRTAGVAVSSFYRGQTSRRERAAELAEMQAEVARLTAANAELQRAAEENELLRRQLAYTGGRSEKFILAGVIGRGEGFAVAGPTQSVMIDRGERDGLVAGMPVLSDSGVLVGKIAAVRDSTALVRLTNHRDCRVAATVIGADGVSGVTEGERGLTVVMRYIPQTATIAIGDLVVTAGLEERMPRGLVIGRVTAVERTPNDVWQSAVVEPLIDPDHLLIVSVPISLAQ